MESLRNPSESVNDVGACRIVQSKQDYPGPLDGSMGGHLAKVQIEGKQNSAL